MLTPSAAAAELLLRRTLKGDLHSFARAAWPYMEGGHEFVDGWHIGAISEHLEAVVNGQIKYLLINMPPRSMKSTLVGVAFPAWTWIEHPELQFFYTTYAQHLTIRDSVACRRLIESAWYQLRWGHVFQLAKDVNTKLKFENDKNGMRLCSSVAGSNTGDGSDIQVADDPNNIFHGDSEVIREGTNTWWDQVMSSRYNDPKKFARIVVQQRTHEQDVSGHVLAQSHPEIVHLCLPMEFEISRKSITVPLKSTLNKPWEDPRTIEGELLWEKRLGIPELNRLKANLKSSYAIAGQLQQRPSPEGGGMIQKDWFKWWKQSHPPKIDFLIQSWDTAMSDEESADYSACTTWGVFQDDNQISNVILLSMWRDRLEFPALRKMFSRLRDNYHDNDFDNPKRGKTAEPDLILVESKMSGLSLVQEIRRMGVFVTPFDPDKYGDKFKRVRLITHLLEGGRVWVPAKPPLYDCLRPTADLFVEECGAFPKKGTRDVVDTMTQVLLYLRTRGWVDHPDDEKEIIINAESPGGFY